jgi:predicted SnoaL-like aldol condensation-catalyzing enzyme
MTTTSIARDTVVTAVSELFGAREPAAVDRWVAPGFVQHSARAADGPEGLRRLIAGLGADFRHDLHRVVADGDLVALHGTYHGSGLGGSGRRPLVGFDVFRVDGDGRLAEHWDALQPEAETTVSGRTETDGPAEVTDHDRTEANRALVTGLVEDVLRRGRAEAIPRYISTAQFDQHNPRIADGLDGLAAGLAAFTRQGIDVVYDTVHRVVAEGNLVLTVAEGRLGETPTAFYDLFRVAGGKVVEHWDATPALPPARAVPHANGLF